MTEQPPCVCKSIGAEQFYLSTTRVRPETIPDQGLPGLHLIKSSPVVQNSKKKTRPEAGRRGGQFYLGTTRLQLEHKGDANGYTYTGIANVVPAFGFLGIPVISWLLDKQARPSCLHSAPHNSLTIKLMADSCLSWNGCRHSTCQ